MKQLLLFPLPGPIFAPFTIIAQYKAKELWEISDDSDYTPDQAVIYHAFAEYESADSTDVARIPDGWDRQFSLTIGLDKYILYFLPDGESAAVVRINVEK